MRNKIILAIIILAASAGAVGFWYYQRNVYSKEILKLEILGPEQAELGQEIEYIVKYKNNGNIKLEDARLVFQYPKYSILEEGGSLRQEIILEDIYPGEEKSLRFKARLLGKKGEIRKAQAWLSYRPKNLKAGYESETSHVIQLKSVPLTLEFDLPSKIEPGKEITFRLNYFSNVNYPLSNLGLQIEYPLDFEFKSARPQPLAETDWEIGLLNKAEGGRIEITGNLRGEVGEQKNFKARLGSWQDGEFVLLKETVRAVKIVTPALYITQEINNNPQYIASPGDTLHYEIFFKNIGQEAFSNLFLVVNLEGEIFDFETLKAPSGEFEIGDNSIIFDWRRIPQLQFLDAQDEGKVEFWIELKDDWQIASKDDKNPVLRNKVYLSQAREEFVTKVNSKLEIVQEKKGQLIVWRAKNYYNDVKDVKVKAKLGDQVVLTGRIVPPTAVLTFDSDSREVIWEVGEMEAGKGIFNEPAQISFEINFPSEAEEIVGEVQITGEDQFTLAPVSGSAAPLLLKE